MQIDELAPLAGNGEDTDYSEVMAKLGLSSDTPDNGAPAMELSTPDATDTTQVPPVVPEEVSTRRAENDRQAKKRIEQSQLTKELDAARARIAELEGLSGKLPALESSLVETKSLAEQRAQELESLRAAYKNEAEAFTPDLIAEIPEVRKAQANFEEQASGLFPFDLADSRSDEPEIRFNAGSLGNAKMNQVVDMINRWEQEEFSSQADPKMRSDIQHVVISNIAKLIGVDADRFVTREIGNAEYEVLPPSHPVYQHLKKSIRPFVEARQKVTMAQTQAAQNGKESLKHVFQQRVSNTKKLFSETGVGLTGDTLKEALSKDPDNHTLQVMRLFEAAPDLLQELQGNVELEASLNGHLRPHLDLAEIDPGERTKVAQTHMRRVGQRAVNAPLAEPLKKLALRQQIQIAELQMKLAKVEAEATKTRRQADPGAVSAHADSGKSDLDGLDPHMLQALKNLRMA